MLMKAFIGITVVFLALIALSFFIYLFGKVMTKSKNKKKTETVANVSAPVEDKSVVVEVDGDDELIAVISAAVSAYINSSGLTPECKIRVKSFKRVASGSPIWNDVNKKELVQNI